MSAITNPDSKDDSSPDTVTTQAILCDVCNSQPAISQFQRRHCSLACEEIDMQLFEVNMAKLIAPPPPPTDTTNSTSPLETDAVESRAVGDPKSEPIPAHDDAVVFVYDEDTDDYKKIVGNGVLTESDNSISSAVRKVTLYHDALRVTEQLVLRQGTEKVVLQLPMAATLVRVHAVNDAAAVRQVRHAPASDTVVNVKNDTTETFTGTVSEVADWKEGAVVVQTENGRVAVRAAENSTLIVQEASTQCVVVALVEPSRKDAMLLVRYALPTASSWTWDYTLILSIKDSAHDPKTGVHMATGQLLQVARATLPGFLAPLAHLTLVNSRLQEPEKVARLRRMAIVPEAMAMSSESPSPPPVEPRSGLRQQPGGTWSFDNVLPDDDDDGDNAISFSSQQPVQIALPLATSEKIEDLHYVVVLELDHSAKVKAKRLLVLPSGVLQNEKGQLEVMQTDGHILAEQLMFPPSHAAPRLLLGMHPNIVAEAHEIQTDHDARSHDVRVTASNTSLEPVLLELWLRNVRKAILVTGTQSLLSEEKDFVPTRDPRLDENALVRIPWSVPVGSSNVIIRWWQ